MRRSVAGYLDIDTSELSIGYHISSITHKPEIFIVERLENGSGYCNYLSGRKYANVPLEAIVRSEERRVGKECRSRWSPYH